MTRRRRAVAVAGFVAAATGAGLAAALAGDLDVAIGAALFRRPWVQAPSSTRAADGLGPLFNARACAACHVRLEREAVRIEPDGRVAGDALVLRFSDARGRPDPVYGRQLQTAAIPGPALPEGRVRRDAAGRYLAVDLAYGPLDPATRQSAVAAPALKGLGRLAAVPDEAIVALADEAARAGVRGRVNWIEMPDGSRRVGRFGHKAGNATLAAQVEQAFLVDLGLSTPGHPDPAGDCTPAEAACRAAPHGGSAEAPEIGADLVFRLAAYLAAVAPPPAPARDPRGERLFAAAGCATCHRPALPSPAGPVAAYTDLLLHDLGADVSDDATASGVAQVEWRTAPLWGLAQTLRNRAGLLHDGRATGVADAVRRHGGDGAASRRRFLALPQADRDRLVAFVGAL